MATRAVSFLTKPDTLDYQDIVLAQWTGLTQATTDDGAPVELPSYPDRSVQVTGTLGAGGSLRIEGSIDGTNYAVLTDPQGNDLNITTLKIESIMEVVRFIRPRITAGDGTTSLACTIIFRRR